MQPDEPQAAPTTEAPSPAAETAPAATGAAASGGGWIHTTAARRIGGAALVVVVACTAIFGANLFGIRDRILPVAKIPTPAAHGAPPAGNGQPVLASYPWWQPVATLQGSGDSTQTVTIGSDALQWRVDWSCQTGHLSVLAHPASPAQLVDAGCSGKGEAITASTGSITLQVTARGPWQLQVAQQVDVPLQQTPLPAMTAPGASVVASGSFYPVNQQGHGTVTIYRLADGSDALRLSNFYVSPNTGLQIQLSTQASPHSDGDITGSPVVVVANLNQTAGSLNFTVPSGIDVTRYHSVVIWCIELRTAYAAANLMSSG